MAASWAQPVREKGMHSGGATAQGHGHSPGSFDDDRGHRRTGGGGVTPHGRTSVGTVAAGTERAAGPGERSIDWGSGAVAAGTWEKGT